MKLVERALVKDLLEIARADTLQDAVLDSMINDASDEAAEFCRRKFEKEARVEYFQSYDQTFFDPVPQFIWLDGPIDLTAPFKIVFSSYGLHDTSGINLEDNNIDYKLDLKESLINVYGISGTSSDPALIGLVGGNFVYSPTGFQVTYTGGYEVTVKPDGEPDDPMDDYGVVQVPRGLKMIVAQKVARDFTDKKMLMPWTDDEKLSLKPYKKKDMI